MGSNFTDLKSIEVVCLSLLIELSAVSLLTDTRFHLIWTHFVRTLISRNLLNKAETAIYYLVYRFICILNINDL